MKNRLIFIFILLLTFFSSGCSKKDHYQVYAVKYLEGSKSSATKAAIGADANDSVKSCYMMWLLRGDNGRIILVDAGYIDSTVTISKKYVRPDLVLKRMKINPDDIRDLIITHPHFDHIDGITLFPRATVWMQKADFDYFVSGKWQEDGHSRGLSKNDVSKILKVKAEGRLKLVDGDDIEIFPGIRVFTGSKHSFENQYLLVNANSISDKIVIASDASWYYYNLDHLLSVPLVIDSAAYIKSLKRMKTLVPDPDLIIPGHDDLVFSKFPKVADWIVRIEKKH